MRCLTAWIPITQGCIATAIYIATFQRKIRVPAEQTDRTMAAKKTSMTYKVVQQDWSARVARNAGTMDSGSNVTQQLDKQAETSRFHHAAVA